MRLALLMGALALVTGCSFVGFPDAKSTTGRAPQVAEIPSPDETVRGADEPPIVTLDAGEHLREHPLVKTDKLPGNIIIPTTNLNGVPITMALQAVLDGTDVSLSWDSSAFDDRLVTVTNLSGPLPIVVEKICASAKVFCNYRGGLLEVKDKETFIVDLPAVPSLKEAGKGATNSMADMIGTLAGEKVHVDQQGGNLVYSTDFMGQENIREYLDELRHGRPLLVMQLYIWEVKLSKDHMTGINWKSFSLPELGGNWEKLGLSGSTGFTSLASPGVSLGAKLAGKVTADGVLQFLMTQGQVQTISNPQLTFVSGSNAEFRVGGKQRYISQVGESTSSVSSTTSTSNTVSTDELKTGLTVTLGGSYESGIISALMELQMEDVIGLNPTKMENGTIIDLPETTERKVSTSLRVRPGDNLVLAGLVSSRDTNDKEGIPLLFGKRLPTYDSDKLENSELVVLVKPSIVLFSDEPVKPEGKPKKLSAEMPVTSAPLPQAVLIDKDGSKPVAVAGQPVQPQLQPQLQPMEAAPAPSEPPAQTAAAETEGIPLGPPTPLSSIQVAPSPDAAPVDKRLMQRGFSYAYDEMLIPVSPDGQPEKGAVP